MQYLICLSSLVFTLLLIRATLEHSPDRFRYKLFACAHFVVLGLGAWLFAHPAGAEAGLLIGLVFSFGGDACLGLRHKRKIYFPLGMLFFILAQFAYLSVFSFRYFNPVVFGVAMFIQILLIAALMMKFGLDLPMDVAPVVLIYDFALVGVFTLALGQYLAAASGINLLRFWGASAFMLSDSILFTVYYIKPKRKVQIILYLLFYHLAQTLFALSLWH
ncbi:MAG: lysoplasmalogenase [Erysipelotrichaceae bacterium]